MFSKVWYYKQNISDKNALNFNEIEIRVKMEIKLKRLNGQQLIHQIYFKSLGMGFLAVDYY